MAATRCVPAHAWRREHALYLQWCHFAEATFARPLGEMVNHRREFDPPQDEILAEMARRGQLCVKALDEALADGREFILGNEFSAADISLGTTSPVIVSLGPD
jgi:glutathione S-transferase|eukprot:COSAG02_NODE_8823_length_2431_cov_2.855060_3_plen_103_part_00